MTFPGKKLVSFLLLTLVLLLPLGSLAQAFAPSAPEECACAMPADAFVAGESGQQSAPATDNDCGDCCESEESESEIGEVRSPESVAGNLPASQIYHNTLTSFIPKVYLSIFVPPES